MTIFATYNFFVNKIKIKCSKLTHDLNDHFVKYLHCKNVIVNSQK